MGRPNLNQLWRLSQLKQALAVGWNQDEAIGVLSMCQNDVIYVSMRLYGWTGCTHVSQMLRLANSDLEHLVSIGIHDLQTLLLLWSQSNI